MVRTIPGFLLSWLLVCPAAVAWTDPAADHEVGYRAAGGPGTIWFDGDDPDRFSHADVVGFGIDETEATITAWVEVAAFPGYQPPDAGPARPTQTATPYVFHEIRFTWLGAAYHFGFHVAPDGRPAFVGLWSANGEQQDLLFHWTIEPDGNRLAASIDKWDLLGPDGRPVVPGAQWTDVSHASYRSPYGGHGVIVAGFQCIDPEAEPPAVFDHSDACGWVVRDEATGGDVVFTQAPGGSSVLAARSPDPIRLSNGEATTYIFDVEMVNLQDAPISIVPVFEGVPPSWSVWATGPWRIEAGANGTFPVAVQVPFMHQHGAEDAFDVVLAAPGTSEAEQVRVPLAVRWTQIPRPAGHHDTIWLHGSDDGKAWWNAMPDDPAATQAEVEFNGGFGSVISGTEVMPQQDWLWSFLSPTLGIGLETTLDAGAAQVAVRGAMEGTATASATVFYCRDECVPLFEGSSEPLAVAQGEVTSFRFPIQGTEAMRFSPGAGNLAISVVVDGGPVLPVLADRTLVAADTWIRLPLVDYHEEIPADLLARDHDEAQQIVAARGPPSETEAAPTALWFGVAALALAWPRRRL